MFTGKWVRLAPVRRDDLELYARWFSDTELLRFMAPGGIQMMTIEDETEWYETLRKTKDKYIFSIRTLEGDRTIGNCSLAQVDWRNRHSMFGIGIGDKAYWGRGCGTDATRILMRYAFDELNLNRVELKVFDYNARAIKSYAKVGFVHEATLRQALFREGQYHDVHIMGLLREDWRKADT